MKEYETNRIGRTAFIKLLERRRIKGNWQWVCIGILTGRENAQRVEGRLNGTR